MINIYRLQLVPDDESRYLKWRPKIYYFENGKYIEIEHPSQDIVAEINGTLSNLDIQISEWDQWKI